LFPGNKTSNGPECVDVLNILASAHHITGWAPVSPSGMALMVMLGALKTPG
jgi:hypothetical protein